MTSFKWGFGLEKETSFIGYNTPLKDFSFSTRNRANYSSHNQSRMRSLGNYALEDGDSTVFSGNSGYGSEIIMRKSKIGLLPKTHIIKFNADVERYAKTNVSGGQTRRTIPFGSIPGVPKRRLDGDVPGSYHFNITFPYAENEDIGAYKKKLKIGLLNLRAIQPLLLAMTGGTSMESIGNPNEMEASVRQLYTAGTSGIGYAKLKEGVGVFDSIDSVRDSGRGPTSNRANWRNQLQGTRGAGYTDIRTKGYIHLPTIEFRFLDVFDTRGTYGVFVAMSLAMANGGRTVSFSDSNSSSVWTKAMKEIAKEGWNAYLDKSYVSYLKNHLKIPVSISTKKIRADLLFKKVFDELWIKNKNDNWIKPWIHERSRPEVHNFSKDSWEFYFVQEMKKESGTLRKKILKFLEVIMKTKTSASNGWIKVNWNSNGYGVRDIILDESVLGSEYGFEDTEDILHCLSRYDILTLREDKAGRIIDIKANYSNDRQLKVKFNKMVDEKDMLNGNEGLIGERDGVPEEEIPEEAPEPITRPTRVTPTSRPTSSSGGAVTINTYIPEDEDNTNMAIDLSQVFANSQLPYNGGILRVMVKYANMSLRGVSFNKPFMKNLGNSGIILYVPSSFENIWDVTGWLDKMKQQKIWHEHPDGVVGAIIPSDLSEEEFYRKLRASALDEYSKGSVEQTISLDRAGVQRLEKSGIYILSYSRGQKYKIVDKRGLRLTNQPKIAKINYIPYQKGFFVKRKESKFTLMKGNRAINSVGGK